MSPVFTPLSDALGIEVTGIDLSAPADSGVVEALEVALVEHLIMVVRDQDLNPAQLLDAVGLFGEVMPQHLTSLRLPDHPEVVVLDSRNTRTGADGKSVPIGARDWHTDHAHQERPPNYTALYAVSLPSQGGDTSFANMQTAFASLPDEMRDDLLQQTVITKLDDRYSTEQDRKEHAGLRQHPLVRTHPVTGRKSIFFHPGMVVRLEGMEPDASHDFLEKLLEQIIVPEIIYRHQWRPGDLVITDNRGQMHVAHTDYDYSEGRTLYRVITEGEVPF